MSDQSQVPSNALSIDCHCVPMEDRPCDTCKLAAVDEQLQRMIVAAEVYVDGEQTVTGYKIKTGALHRLIGLRNLFVPQHLPVVSAHEPCERHTKLADELESDLRAQGSKVIEFHHSRVRTIIEALRASPPPGESRMAALERALRYWLPDETMIPKGHEAAWNEHVVLIPEHYSRSTKAVE